MRKIIFLLLYIVISIFSYSNIDEAKNVLIINSYGYDFSLTQKIMKGITESFEENKINLNLEVEFLDTKKMMNEDYYEKLAEMYKEKFKYTKLDIIICSDNEALSFVEKNRKELFSNVPIVFCGINGYNPNLLMGDKNITGIVEELSIFDTVNIALKLHKGIKNVVVLNDKTQSGKMFKELIIKEDLEKKLGVKVVFLENLNLDIEKLSYKLKDYEKDSILLYTVFSIDKSNKKISNEQTIKKIKSISNIPIYGLYEAFLDFGIIGGKLISRKNQGKEAGDLAIKILNKEPIENLPIISIKADSIFLNYEELYKFEVNNKNIPKEAIIVNKPISFYERVKDVIWYFVTILIFLIFIILLLVKINIKNRKLNKIIIDSKLKDEKNINFIRNVINSAPSMYSVKNKYGKIILCNTTFSEFFNLEIDKVENHSLFDIFGKLNLNMEVAKKMAKDDLIIFEEKKSNFGVEDLIIFENNEEKWIYSNIVPIEIENEVYSLRVSLDITKRKNIEVELNNAKEEAEKLSISKGHFLAIMSHEIRTPLNGIIAIIEQLKDKIEELKSIDKEINIMDISAKRLNDVIDKTLNYSKIEYGNLDSEIIQFDLRKEIKNCIILFNDKIKEKKLDIFLYVENKVPYILKGDIVKYHQVLTNIIGNAVKFTNIGYISIEVYYLKDKKNSYKLKTVVKDTGIGIDEKYISQIFNRFSQVKNSHNNGVGLGLAISKELVDRLDGDIYVESKVNVGSTFTLEIPFDFIESKPYRIKKIKEFIIFCDNDKYLEFYAKTINNIPNVNCIIAQNLEEFNVIIDNYDNYNNLYIIIDSSINLTLEKFSRNQIIKVGNNINEINRFEIEETILFILNKSIERPNHNANINNYTMFENKKILLVEDDEISKDVFFMIFNSFGFKNIEWANNGSEGLRKLKNYKYDLIFLDLQLPNISGVNIFENSKESINDSTPIIALTASTMEETKEKCISMGFYAYLTKPITKKNIINVLNDVFSLGKNNFILLEEEFSGNLEIMKKLLISFRENIPNIMKELRGNVRDKNFIEISKILHKLKGAVGNIKNNNIYQKINSLEELLKFEKFNEFILLEAQLEIDINNLILSINYYLDSQNTHKETIN